MPLTTDQALSFVTVSIMALALAFTIFRLAVQRSSLNWTCFAAAVSQSIVVATQITYNYLTDLECKVRYFNLYFFLGLGKILVYYLYEQRLAILVNRAKINPFRWIIYALLLFYVGFVIAQVTVNMRDCYLTSTGSATVSSSASSICKYISNVLDICLGTTILFGSFYSLGLLMAENARAGIRSSGGYKLILTSDALRYLAVFPVEVYKMAVSSDASGSDMGFFPPGTGNGNNGFLQVINAYKIAAMIFLLVLPGMLVARSGLNPGSSNPDSKLASISSDSETQAPRMHDI